MNPQPYGPVDLARMLIRDARSELKAGSHLSAEVDAELAACALDAQGDFAAVGDQDLLEHAQVRQTRAPQNVRWASRTPLIR